MVNSTSTIINKLHSELEVSKTAKKDSIIPFLCKILPSQEFVEAADDEDFLSSLLYELGFGLLGVRPDSWAAQFRGDPNIPASCFSALYLTATTETTRSTLASSRRIISRCCNSRKDL
ncbi:unnamed protein product [Rotaria socialis]|uniref:Uncharacterized protein n=1 Tax=Rotaria socialis TaxID=392032 RepID=A0A820JNY7_9BILA|nr:unnamed protein product [Rotaria socialis]